MTFSILPALIALAIKLLVLWSTRNSDSTQQSLFSTLVLIFALHNLSEIGLFLQHSYTWESDYIMRCYYALTYFVLSTMFVYAIDVSRIFKNKWHRVLIYLITGLIASYTFLTNGVIQGIITLEHVLTALKGDQYWLFQVFVLGTLASIVITLITGYFRAKSHTDQIKCLYTLLSLSPIVLVSSGAIILMKLGVPINALMIVPIASTLLILITLYSEEKHLITDIRRYLPLSLEQRTIRKVSNETAKYLMDKRGHKETIHEIERLFIRHKHKKENENITKAAESMKVGRSTLYQMLVRLNLKIKDD